MLARHASRVAAMALAAVTVAAQTPNPSTRSFRTLQTTVTQAADTGALRELRVRPSAPSGSAQSRAFAVFTDRRLEGRLRRERSPQLAGDRLVLSVRDADGRDLSWQIVPNPWIVRAETPDASGLLSGQLLQRDDEAVFTVPDIRGMRSVAILQPRWDGTDYALDLIGEVPVS